MPPGRQLLVAGVGVTGACASALIIPNYFVYLATTAVVLTLLARSVGTVTGQAGMISLCQMTFCAIGAWVTDWLNLNLPVIPFIIQLASGSLVALGCGFLIGLPALRLRGINLAAVTLAFAVSLDAVLTTVGFPSNETVVIFQRPIWLVDDSKFLVFCVALAGAVLLALGVIRKTKLGASWAAVKFSERACASLGISVAAAKLAAFSVSAAIAGLAGGLLIAQLGTVTARNFDPLSSLVVFALGVFTGAQFVEGAILAGALTVAVPEVLRRLGLPLDLDALIFAVGAIDALRRGAGLAEGLRAKLTSKSSKIGSIAAAKREITLTAPEVGRVVPLVREPVLEIVDLTVRYGEIVALEKLNLRIEDDSITALVGPNGAGKSTLVDAVSGFIQPSEGRIRSAGTMLNDWPAHRRARAGIRRTFQQGRAMPELTVGAFIRLAGRHGLGLTDTYVNEIVEFFDCPDPSTIIADVEVGLRRVVEVAAAVAARPRLVLLDEPAAGLSSGQSRQLGDRIAAIPQRFGCAIVLIEHDMELVRSACDTVVVLDFGRMIACGSPSEVLGRPEVAAAYLGVAEP
jgi:branched-chain amino acid transport system permease protein